MFSIEDIFLLYSHLDFPQIQIYHDKPGTFLHTLQLCQIWLIKKNLIADIEILLRPQMPQYGWSYPEDFGENAGRNFLIVGSSFQFQRLERSHFMKFLLLLW